MLIVKQWIRNTTIALIAGLILSAVNGYAIDFYGATVSDGDVPSSYLRVGLFGFRPIVTTVSFGSLAAKHGLQRGDIILSINDREIKKSSELNQFTTGVLSVSIFRVNRKMTVSINRPSIESPKISQIAAVKQAITQRQITGDATAVAVNPPVKIDNRAPEKEKQEVNTGSINRRDLDEGLVFPPHVEGSSGSKCSEVITFATGTVNAR